MNMKTTILAGRSFVPVSDFDKTRPAARRTGAVIRSLARIGVIAGLGVVMSGCAMTQLGSMFGGSSDEGTTASISNPVLNSSVLPQERSLAMAANDMVAPAATQAGAVGDCPRISIWKNDAQLTIYEIGRVGDNLAIKHRGEITKTARECEIAPGQVTVKFGVAGRVLLGPLGRAGAVKLPVLVHVTNRKSEKIQTSKLDVVVNMVGGKPYGNFSTVRSVSFPTKPGIPANQYRVFVTFDKTAPGAG